MCERLSMSSGIHIHPRKKGVKWLLSVILLSPGGLVCKYWHLLTTFQGLFLPLDSRLADFDSGGG